MRSDSEQTMTHTDVPANLICRDLSGALTLEGAGGGPRRYVKLLAARAATPGYRSEVKALQASAGPRAAPLVEEGAAGARLSFVHDGWEPFAAWRLKLHAGEFFPLESALRAAISVCATLRQVWDEATVRPEIHGGIVLFHESGAAECRLLLWPAVKNVRPADYLLCTPDVIMCTPPEALCGQENTQPHVYAAGMMLRQIFADAAPFTLSPPALIERMVGEHLPPMQVTPARLPAGFGHVLRPEFEQLAGYIARSTARHPRGRDVTLDQLIDACQSILDRLDYDRLMRHLRREGRFEEACDIGEYGVRAKSGDHFWRRALKRQCGEIYLNELHRYERAAALFHDYLTTEAQTERDILAQVREHYGDALAAMGLHGMALGQYEQALANIADRARLYLKIAATHRRHGDHRKAGWTLQRLLNDNPKNWQALKNMAEIYLYYENDPQTARAHAAGALQVVNDYLKAGVLDVASPSGVVADLRALIGLCLLVQGHAEDAQLLAGQALQEDDDCYRAHNIFGLLYMQQGKIVPAMRSLGTSLRLMPDQPEIKRWLEAALGTNGQG